ncbi:MAG: MBOAT family protein [Clostridia bacterium]|nr:MBOAT family protein [Clostridia bacterium]
MLFSGIPFLFYFLPAVLIFYFLLPQKARNGCLLLFSLIFYAWGEPVYIFLMIASIVSGYFLARGIEKYRKSTIGNICFFLAVAISLSALGFFKYFDFVTGSINSFTGLNLPILKIALPIGISFYTFQLLSYVIDVKRGDVPAQKNIIDLACYITMFPQLIAGPIVRYSDILTELNERTHSFERASLGIRRFVMGLSKKVLIANTLGELCDVFRETNEVSVVFYWMYALCSSLQLYFDFYGYSDMAIGIGHIFGFHFIENFNYPFISKSIAEFWRRWHMSLGSWFRDYVYIPMGGNRVKPLRWFFNILTVWMLTGLWHGAAWNFVVWGLYFAFFLVIEKLFLSKLLEKSVVLSHIYVIITVLISFVIFSSPDIPTAGYEIKALLGLSDIPFITNETMYYLKSYAFLICLALIGSTPFVKTVAEKVSIKWEKAVNVLEVPVLFALFVISVAYLVDGSFNPFLYFRF